MGRKEAIWIYVINSLTLINESFWWSVVYQRYVNLFTQQKKRNNIWPTRLTNTVCVPKVFDFREIVYLCAHKFDLKTKKITLVTKNTKISLTIEVFSRIFKLPILDMFLYLSKENIFLESQAGGSNIIQEFCNHPFTHLPNFTGLLG